MLSAIIREGQSNERHWRTDEIEPSVSDTPLSKNQEILKKNNIQTWITTLPEKELSESMMIRDESFVSTILELRSSSFTSKSPTQLEEEKATALSYSLDKVEEIYRRFTNMNHSNALKSTTINAIRDSSSSIDERVSSTGPINTVIPSPEKASPSYVTCHKVKCTSEHYINSNESEYSLGYGENIKRLHDKSASDAFRIQDESYRIPQLEKHANLIFPSVIDFILKQRGYIATTPLKSTIPLIALDVSSVDVHSLSNRLHRCLQEFDHFTTDSVGDFWTYWVRQRFCEDNKVSISDLLLARAEVALVETYKAYATSVCKRNQDNFGKSVAGIFVERSQKAKVTMMEIPDDNFASQIPLAPKNAMNKSQGYVFDADMKSILKDIVAFSQDLRQFAKQDDLQKLKSVCSGIVNSKDQLPLVPMMALMKACKGERDVIERLSSLNDVLEKVLSSVISRAEKSGFKLKPTLATTTIKIEQDQCQNHMHESSISKKRKKKCRTKKVKSSTFEKTRPTIIQLLNVGRRCPDKECIEMESLPLECDTSTVANHGNGDCNMHKEIAQTSNSDISIIQSVSNCESTTPLKLPLSTELSVTNNEYSLNAPECDDIPTVEIKGDFLVAKVEESGNIGVDIVSKTSVSVIVEKELDSGVTDCDANLTDEIWETVGGKGKGRSRRNFEHNISPPNNNIHAVTRKGKNTRPVVNRKRNQSRRMNKGYHVTHLSAVDQEVKRFERKVTVSNPTNEATHRISENSTQIFRRDNKCELVAKSSAIVKSNSMPVQDVVSLRQELVPLSPLLPCQSDSISFTAPPQKKEIKSNRPYALEAETLPRQHLNASADQNTASTLPETLSGTSANTQSSINTESETNFFARPPKEEPILGDSSFDEIKEASPKLLPFVEKEEYSTPPLQTLLGPGNANSASSSVASSLDAPHCSSHRHHHHCSVGNESDVGYHLLDVCDRLSKDMDIFMARRADALCVRRKERGALLSALQDTANRIWTECAQIEMYGSCATQLDLPSSDLDVVIRGLYRPEHLVSQSHSQPCRRTATTYLNGRKPVRASPCITSHTGNSNYGKVEAQRYDNHRSPFTRMPLISENGERVLRLAAELEQQPWAVQIKAIPTASVPVIKILADPSRLPGILPSARRGDWLIQQHNNTDQATEATSDNYSLCSTETRYHSLFPPNVASFRTSSTQYPHQSLPWRGADVMNGLISVDITFEGPEHGGIGSTEFSSRVVQDACDETGLPVERTPTVQVLMVLKELLAQRRLNEPFSGGLSSYALLLLLVAVMKERNAIRDEMKRMEKHRHGLTDETTTASTEICDESSLELKCTEKLTSHLNCEGQVQPQTEQTGNPASAYSVAPNVKAENVTDHVTFKNESHNRVMKLEHVNRVCVEALSREAPSGLVVVKETASSWASIARMNSVNTVSPTTARNVRAAEPAAPVICPKVAKKVNSFAEAVSGKQSSPRTWVRKPGKSNESSPSQQYSRKQREKTDLDHKSPSKTGAPPLQPPTKIQREATPLNHAVVQKSSATAKSTPQHVHQELRNPKAASSKNPISTVTSAFLVAPVLPVAEPVHETSHMNVLNSDSIHPCDFSMFPQGSNDVLEVLCSGETTAGKLLMHFLLFYGRHFDSSASSIEVAKTHHLNTNNAYSSPFIPRRSGGTIDPYTGMLTVDPIVVLDPWEGGVNNNVARSCFAWSSIRWHFAQCYLTLSSAVERCGAPPHEGSPAISHLKAERMSEGDVLSPLLELLLSF